MGTSASSFAHSHAESRPCQWQKEYPARESRRLDSQWVIKSDWKIDRYKQVDSEYTRIHVCPVEVQWPHG